MKIKITTLLLTCVILLIACFLGIERKVTYTSAETGSRKGAVFKAGFIKMNSWEQPSWVELRARKMGIFPKQQTWVKTADTRRMFISTSHRHSKAPASMDVDWLDPDSSNYTPIDLNSFVRKFILANESERIEMMRQFSHGGYNQ